MRKAISEYSQLKYLLLMLLSLCLIVGFLGFLVSLWGAIAHGFSAEGAARPALLRWLASCAACFALLMLSLKLYPAPLPSSEEQIRARLIAPLLKTDAK